MKALALAPLHLSGKKLVGIILVVFVLASGVVGYVLQTQSAAGPIIGGYGVPVPGPMQGIQQQTTFLAYTSTVASTVGPNSTSFGGRMLELEGDMTIQVADSKAAADQASQLAASLGGYVASSSFDVGSATANLVLEVPQSNFSLAMRSLSRLGAVKTQSISSNDVAGEYVDLQAQLESYVIENRALLRILNETTTVTDALNTENAIQSVQAQINDLKGQLLAMQSLVAFATVNMQLIEPPQSPTLSFSDALNSALLAFYTVAKGMLILGASLVPVAAVCGIIYLPYRRFSRKKPEQLGAK